MNSPHITIIMSVYNGQSQLSACMESVLAQSHRDFTFYIIDDASTDETPTILANYAKQDSRIHIVTNTTNLGLGVNLQHAVQNCPDGGWIARMDADDICLPHRLQTQLDYAKDNPNVDIIGSWAHEIDDKEHIIGIRKTPTSHDIIAKYIWTCPVIHPTVMFKKDSIIKAGSYGDEPRRQDYALWFRALAAGLTFANIDEPLLLYRNDSDYYKKNSPAKLWEQVTIGWRGCRLVGATPLAYIAITVPLIRSLFPVKIQQSIAKLLKRVDPRTRHS